MRKNRLYILVFVLLAAPFYLNDFSSIYVKSWRWWLFIDYTSVKLFPFLVVLWLVKTKRMELYEFGLTRQAAPQFIAVFLTMTLVGTIIDQNGYKLLADLPGYTALGGMPPITSKTWDWIDLTAGLLLVGIFEELVFRGYLCTFVSRYTENPVAIVAVSAVAFGLIHWSLGVVAVVVTAVVGAAFMAAYLKTRSMPSIMLAHFMVNFIDYAGVIPKTIFKFV